MSFPENDSNHNAGVAELVDAPVSKTGSLEE